MTPNPYAAPSAFLGDGNDSHIAVKRLKSLSHLTIASSLLWIGMMIIGRLLDQQAPPIRSVLSLYTLVGLPALFALYGAYSTLKRERYAICVFGAACASVPLLGPWCGLTVPIGIWSLILLGRRDIRSSFAVPVDLDPDSLDSADDAFAHAARLDTIGEWDRAIATYQNAAQRWPEHGERIENCIAEITFKRSAAT